MTKKSDAPAIRFKGFSDAWEQRKLTEFVEFFSGLTYTPNDVQENGTLVLRSSNVSNGEVVDADNIYVNPQVVNSENVKVGDIVVVVRNGSRSLIGKHAQIKAFMPNTVIGAFMTGIRSECPEFTNALLNTSRFEEEIAMNMGATINQITGYMFSKMEFKVPCLDEQKKIGEYFEKLDNLITLHQRKFEKLTNVKKSMLEKMFPQNGSSYPEIRFKGFTDPWEQRKLGEIGSVSMCRRIFKEQTSETGDIPFYKIGTFGAEPDAFISRELFEEYKSKYPYPKKGDILISASGSIGRTVEFAGNNEYFQDSNIVWLSHDERLSNSFLKCFYSVVKWAGIEGSTIKRLYNDNILNTVICMPSVPEQEHIGLFFENLDNLITLHQRKFEKLTNVKKSMLEKMFPQNGSSYPEIRFKGFTDPWEQRKFSDITFPAGEKNRDNLPLESYSITNEHGFVPQDEKFENGGTMREADKRMYYIVSPNSFAYNPARINVGSIGYQNIGKNVIVSSLYEVFKTSEDVDDRLLWHWFKSPDFQKLIMQLQEGGVRLYFYYDKLCMGEVSLPSLEEQRKIGKLFDTLDNLITLHQRELEKLQNIKKSMLEKMFV